MVSQPVGGGEEEVGGLGHPVLAGPYGFDVPHQQPVEDGVEEQHAHAARHGEGVAGKRAHLGQGVVKCSQKPVQETLRPLYVRMKLTDIIYPKDKNPS